MSKKNDRDKDIDALMSDEKEEVSKDFKEAQFYKFFMTYDLELHKKSKCGAMSNLFKGIINRGITF